MDKESKKCLIDVIVSSLWVCMVIFLIVGGVSMSRLIYYDPTIYPEWLVGLVGVIFYLAGVFIVWFFAFDSINRRQSI